MTDWQPGDPVHPEPPPPRGSCGPCLVAWTAETDRCPECGELSTELLASGRRAGPARAPGSRGAHRLATYLAIQRGYAYGSREALDQADPA